MMATSSPKASAALPIDSFSFTLLPYLHASKAEYETSPRLGKVHLPHREAMSTPHYIGLTSRGTVPHLSQDMMRDHTSISGVYAALEDYIERQASSPPVLATPCRFNESPLRRFISLQESALLILGPRRIPPISCPASNTHSAVSILTSVGFGALEVEDYVAAVLKLRPDIALGMGDIVSADGEKGLGIGVKRKEKMAERTFTWVRELINGLRDMKEEGDSGTYQTALFAPILPIEREMQSDYVSELYDNPAWKEILKGFTLYSTDSIDAIPLELSHLPRLSLASPTTPHSILQSVSLGIDLFTLPFINEATEAGIAFSFTFSAPPSSPERLALGFDMWSPTHSKAVSPLMDGCKCYACTHHHRAYIQHLLSAKEMLAWVLLQVHNHHIMDKFFAGIRESIANGTFEEQQGRFGEVYESELPIKTGQGPRIRGYQHHHSGPSKSKSNPSSYRKLAEPTPNTSVQADFNKISKMQPEEMDAEWPIPNVSGRELEEVGFAKVVGE